MTGSPADRIIVVQARAGSTRLPGKVLADLGGMPMLALQLRRLLESPTHLGALLVVATSDLPIDDPVAELAATLGVEVVRGPEADVLGRYAIALDRHPATTVVRLTGDCPLTDPAIVAAALDLHDRSGADYTSNVLPRSFPKGLDVEVFAASALETIRHDATDPADREHVTPFLYRHPARFRLANLHSGQDLGEEWWTVDTAEDLSRLRDIVSRLDDPVHAAWEQVLTAVGATTRPRPGITLRPLPGPAPGTAPWVRTWAVELDGERIGDARVSAGDGVHEVAIDVAAAHEPAATMALAELLTGDQQTRA